MPNNQGWDQKMKFGIDAIGFYSSRYYLDLATLATRRGIDVDKFCVGLGQKKMAVPPPGEDIITLATNAAQEILHEHDREKIELVLFATESGIDHSKAAGIYIQQLLNLPARCRVLELKQACYAATGGMQLALAWLRQYPEKKVLLLAADIARYGFNTSGESSQGAGAVALLLSASPRLVAIESESGFYTEDVMDFWRPNYRDEALVDGKYSCELYLKVLGETWKQYRALSHLAFKDHDYFCYHVPVPRLVEKAHRRLAKLNGHELSDEAACQQMDSALVYSREIGNCYTAALYVSLLSLLENQMHDLTGSFIGLYSYGSGCVGEYFGAEVIPGYDHVLRRERAQQDLALRHNLSYEEYENFYNFKLPIDGSFFALPQYDTGKFRLKAIDKHKRIYEKT